MMNRWLSAGPRGEGPRCLSRMVISIEPVEHPQPRQPEPHATGTRRDRVSVRAGFGTDKRNAAMKM